eukprot:CAMPEP_0204393006 /NCGR_PEP_ID=MMETSP0469-20131031/62085_1 /ASSEMBLY_ACC=CAM_ASM_000384 /TAXON_ID=2969 /ORGANISM="Oxyrrhis marina" /LENGTH=88 /DNA_ID=CAMNT_0051387047 /DNA_START=98 /DNA_END=364 /DNA_ORIENTATION=+
MPSPYVGPPLYPVTSAALVTTAPAGAAARFSPVTGFRYFVACCGRVTGTQMFPSDSSASTTLVPWSTCLKFHADTTVNPTIAPFMSLR